jgi:PadR family transcriptional regulator, regulatory protein PadR
MHCCFDMRGFLSYLVLWSLKDRTMNGAEIAKELEKRKGSKPSPGTIYPVLKELKDDGLVSCDDNKDYSLTKKGEKELKGACAVFCRQFYDFYDMRKCCRDDSSGTSD